jgi:hypothetical protein
MTQDTFEAAMARLVDKWPSLANGDVRSTWWRQFRHVGDAQFDLAVEAVLGRQNPPHAGTMWSAIKGSERLDRLSKASLARIYDICGGTDLNPGLAERMVNRKFLYEGKVGYRFETLPDRACDAVCDWLKGQAPFWMQVLHPEDHARLMGPDDHYHDPEYAAGVREAAARLRATSVEADW